MLYKQGSGSHHYELNDHIARIKTKTIKRKKHSLLASIKAWEATRRFVAHGEAQVEFEKLGSMAQRLSLDESKEGRSAGECVKSKLDDINSQLH